MFSINTAGCARRLPLGKNLPCVVAGVVALALMFGGLLSGDDKKPTKGYLPSGWKKLDLTATQKEKIYAIQGEYKTKIRDLKKQISALERKRYAELLTVLTNKQKAQLVGLDESKDSVKDKKDGATTDTKRIDKKDK